MADSRDCIMHPRVGETPTPTPPRSMHGNVPGFSRNIRGSWNLWWKGDRDTHTMCFHSSIMNNCDVQRASFQAQTAQDTNPTTHATVGVHPRRTRVLSLRGTALERIFHPTDFSRIFISLVSRWFGGKIYVRWMVCTVLSCYWYWFE